MTHSSPSSSARVFNDARSEPASGSEKPWHQAISPRRIFGRKNCFCSSLPHCKIVGPTSVSPKKSARIGAFTRANSSFSTTLCMIDRPRPPYSVGQEAQIQPPSASFGVHSLSNWERSSGVIENPGVPHPSGRFSSSQARTSSRKASASGG